jgi:hypothetical protein
VDYGNFLFFRLVIHELSFSLCLSSYSMPWGTLSYGATTATVSPPILSPFSGLNGLLLVEYLHISWCATPEYIQSTVLYTLYNIFFSYSCVPPEIHM